MSYHNLSCDLVFTACMKAVANAGYGMRQSNPPSFIEVQTPNRLKAWDGVLSVIITPSGSGSEITINASTHAMNFGKVGMMAKLEAEGAAGMSAARLNSLISTSISNIKVPIQALTTTSTLEQIQAPTSNMSTLDELAKLKTLLDGGALTQEEFDILKKKLLS